MGTITAGLEGVIAGESEICASDAHAGVLSYRSYSLHTPADNAIIVELVFVLWIRRLPRTAELDQLERDLARERELSKTNPEFLVAVGKCNTMDVLRTAVSM